MNSIRLAVSSVVIALSYPRIWLTALAVVFIAGLLHVFPVFREMDRALAHYPGAGLSLQPGVDDDLAREVPLRISMIPGGIFMILVWTFLAGGILATVGTREKFRFTDFLSEGGRLFLRNLRVVVIGLPVALLLFWGVGVLDSWIREDLLYDSDPGNLSLFGWQPRIATWEFLLEILSNVWAVLFMVLVFTSHVAMARLAMDNRRSALAAWVTAGFLTLRHPIRFLVVVLTICVIFIGGVFGLGELTVLFLEAQPGAENLWLGLLTGQAGIAFTQVMLVAFLLAGRKLLALGQDSSEQLAEPVVELPRRRVVVDRRKVSARA